MFGFLRHDMYLVKTPWWIKKLYKGCIWDLPAKDKILYFTFDDGPHPSITPFVLSALKKHNAKATFFLIGDNAKKYPETLKQIIDEGHSIGNHTMHHISGWKSMDDTYLNDIKEAETYIASNLFRPPYGRIKKSQIKKLTTKSEIRNLKSEIIMWNILAGDWVQTLTPEKCFAQIKDKIYPGAIVVFHDSEKAFERMKYAFPKLLEHAAAQGYRFEAVPYK